MEMSPFTWNRKSATTVSQHDEDELLGDDKMAYDKKQK